MFILNFIIALIGYAISDERPSEKSSILGSIGKFFMYQYGMYKRGVELCFSRFVADIFCLTIHCAILCALNIGYDKINVILQFAVLEAVFYFSEFTMRIFPYSINFKKDFTKVVCVYLFEVVLCQTRLFISEGEVSMIITLVAHFALLVALITKKIKSRKHVVLFQKADQCLLINLKEDVNSSLNSNNENAIQHYVLRLANKIQLISVTHPKLTPQISPQQSMNNADKDCGKAHNEKGCSNNNNHLQEPHKLTHTDSATQQINIQTQISNLNRNTVSLSNDFKNVMITEDKQMMIETRDKQLTITKSSQQPPKFKSEDEPTARKQTTVTDSPQLVSQCVGTAYVNSNHGMLTHNNGVNTSICQNHNIACSNLNNLNLPVSQSIINSNHQTAVNLKYFEQTKDQNPSPTTVKSNQVHSRIRSLSIETESINVDIVNTLELEVEKDSTFEIVSFHEESQCLLIKTDSAVFFYSVPDFKKTKSILLDKNSQYLFHQIEPYCIQYHYNPNSYQFQFTYLNLSQPKITKEDMKYNSLTMQNTKFDTNGLIFYSSFVSDQSAPKDILFIADGQDLIAINMENLAMENYTGKLPVDEIEKVQIQQLNKRQIVINAPHQTQLTKLVLDVPTNICCRKFTNLPVSTEMISIENLQNQIILNNQKINKSSCVFDINTREVMELPGSKTIKKAWSVNKMLYVVDESSSIKIYSFVGSKFNLLPPNDNGISCVSIGFF